MEQLPDSIHFERETVLNIRGMRIIVTSHFDDTQESLPEKLARLLKKAVGSTLDKSVNL